MTCPTCDHTMECFAGGGPEDERNRYLCPRCGTVKVTEPDEPDQVYVPKLVERCRHFDKFVRATLDGQSVQHWHGMGISESINTPANRP